MSQSTGFQPPPYRPPMEKEAYEMNGNAERAYIGNTPLTTTLYNAKENGNGSYFPERRTSGVGVLDDSGGPAEVYSAERETLLAPSTPAVKIIRSSYDNDDMLPPKGVPTEEINLFAPKDRFHLVYTIMLLHGMGVLLPWNAFINAGTYFIHYKLAPILVNGTAANGSFVSLDSNEEYRTKWTDSVTMASQLPNLLLNGLNLFVNLGGSLTFRIVVSIGVLIFIMLETMIFAIVNTTTWSGTFFIVTILSIVVVNMATGIYQNSLFGLAASLPRKYTNAVIIGNNVCGTFISILNVMSISLFPDRPRIQAIYYFLIAVVFLVITFISYFLLPLTKYYRHFAAKQSVTLSGNAVPKRSFRDHLLKLWSVFKEIKIQCWNVFFVFFVTLAAFPSISMNVQKLSPDFFLNDTYFTAVGCFLFFNLFAFVGNLIPFAFAKPGPKWVWLPVLLRVLLIPFLIYCNLRPEKPERTIPVLLDSDWAFIIGVILLGVTSGYFSSLCMMYAPGEVRDPRNAPVAGQIAAFFLVIGIFIGLQFPRLVWLII